MKGKKQFCPTCEQPIMKHKHRFSKAMAHMLVVVSSKYKQGAPFNINKDLGFTHNQMCNFPKLKYWGLLAKYYENGVHQSGYWYLTKGVRVVLEGRRVPIWVTTFANKVKEYSEETTSLRDAVGYYEMPEEWAERSEPNF